MVDLFFITTVLTKAVLISDANASSSISTKSLAWECEVLHTKELVSFVKGSRAIGPKKVFNFRLRATQ